MVRPVPHDRAAGRQLAEKYASKLRVGKVDADINQNILIDYGIMGIPT